VTLAVTIGTYDTYSQCFVLLKHLYLTLCKYLPKLTSSLIVHLNVFPIGCLFFYLQIPFSSSLCLHSSAIYVRYALHLNTTAISLYLCFSLILCTSTNNPFCCSPQTTVYIQSLPELHYTLTIALTSSFLTFLLQYFAVQCHYICVSLRLCVTTSVCHLIYVSLHLCHYICVSLRLCVTTSVCHYICVSLHLCVTTSVCHYICVSLHLCVTISVSLHLCVTTSVCHYICVSLHLCVITSVCHYFCVTTSVCHYVCVSLHLCVTTSLCHYVCVSLRLCVTTYVCHTICVPHYLCATLSVCHATSFTKRDRRRSSIQTKRRDAALCRPRFGTRHTKLGIDFWCLCQRLLRLLRCSLRSDVT
jgi:hypothetical protein